MFRHNINHLLGEHLDSAIFAFDLGNANGHLAHLHLSLNVAFLALVQLDRDTLNVALQPPVKLDDGDG